MKKLSTLISVVAILFSPFLHAQVGPQKSDFSSIKSRVFASNFEKLDSTINKAVNDLGQMVNESKEEFTYDIAGNLIQNIDYEWDLSSNSWTPDSRWDLDYNENNLPQTIINFFWDVDSDSWVRSAREVLSYDAEGNETQSVIYNWDTDSQTWILDYKIESTYDQNGNILSFNDFIWNDTQNTWEPFSRTEYEYDNNLLLAETSFNYQNGDYLPTERSEFEYDGSGNRISQTNYFRINDAWEPNYRYEYDYNSEGMVIEENTFIYLGGWVNDLRYVYSYPYSVAEENLVLPDYFYEMQGETSLDALASFEEYQWNSGTETFDLIATRELSFSEFDGTITSSIKKVKTELSFYPNPARNIVHLEMPHMVEEKTHVEITSLDGRSIRTFENTSNLNLMNISSGAYIIKVRNEEYEYSGKLWIE